MLKVQDHSSAWLLSLCSLLAAIILLIDLLIPLGVAGGVPYIAVILLASRLPKRDYLWGFAILCTALTLLGAFLSPPGGELWQVATNRFLALTAIWISAVLLLQRQRDEVALVHAHDELEGRVQKRTAELTTANHQLQQEIAERQQIEQALQESEARYRSLSDDILDTSRVGVFILDAEFRVVWVNQAIADYFGLPRKTLQGANKRQLIQEQLKDCFEQPEDFAKTVLATYTDNSYIEQFECHLLPNGERQERWLEHWSQPIGSGLYAGGRIEHYYDITERKRVEFELRTRARQQTAVAEVGRRALRGGNLDTLLDETLALLARILDVAYGQVLELLPDRKTFLLRASVGFKRSIQRQATVNVEPDTLAGYTLLSLEPVIVENLSTEHRFRPESLLLEHGLASGVSLIIPGRERPFGILGVYTPQPRNFSHELCFLQTVATLLATGIERQRAEEQTQLQQAELAHIARLGLASELTAGLAHELNQPLTAITTNAHTCLQLLHSGMVNMEKFEEILEEVTRQSERAGEIVHHLRALVRKTEYRKTAVNLNDLVHEVARLANIEARQQGVQLRLELFASLPPVWGDNIQLQQVILNLVCNSIEAMGETSDGKRELTIQTSPVDCGAVEVTVSDTGPGLSPEAMKQLFQPFFTTKPTGMGLGLSLSKSIVEAHGGEIWATPNPSRGATFHFTISTKIGNR
ncbi:PAS sensor protein [Nitrosococcus halophilus Nc 4]|uniref:histidine kinase n=1 Tax=Nitrosococcus halophilus (strain Nc4) TaxID=472759 RepID=D5C1K4_NITHN|nr:ATP-binding protein [Nitrosococcus halophilus]ADE16556.1 PAS sensor protein [Nitrosococcus halophilus Nc 4]